MSTRSRRGWGTLGYCFSFEDELLLIKLLIKFKAKIMDQTSQTIEATWGIVLKLWWWVMWRSVLVGFVGGFIVGFVGGFILGFIGLDSDLARLIIGLLSFIFGFVIYLFFFRKIFGKKFKDFTVVLLKTN